jgi:hypothetical protein
MGKSMSEIKVMLYHSIVIKENWVLRKIGDLIFHNSRWYAITKISADCPFPGGFGLKEFTLQETPISSRE